MLRRVEAFLVIADEEFAAAERLSAALPRQAQYFLQQSVEKLIRAVLERENIAAGTGHNISFLAGLMPLGHFLRRRFEAFDHLSAASTRYRYPSPTGVLQNVSAVEVSKTLIEVAALREEVKAFCRK